MNFTIEEIRDILNFIDEYSYREDSERGNSMFCVYCDADSLSPHDKQCEVKRLLDLLNEKLSLK